MAGARVRSPDGRNRGSMSQFVREFLSLNPTGWTRADLQSLLRGRVEFTRQFQRNPRAYSNMICRLIDRGDIEDRDGKLFATEPIRLSVVVRKDLFELAMDPS